MHKASHGGMGSACLCKNTRSPTVKGLLAIQSFYPHFGFLNEVEWEGGIFFQMKGKGRDGVILFLSKTKKKKMKNKTKILSLIYTVRM